MEMLEVLAHEFGDMIPLETEQHVLEANSPGSLIQMRESSLIQVLPQHTGNDPLKWQFIIT